jgi:uncharacterized protein (DUF433 family)
MCALSATQPVNHIRVDADSSAWIEGTTYRVRTIVLDLLVDGLSPEEIRYQHYNELTMAQIHSALAYYYDHKEQVDAEIAAELELVDRLRAEAGEPPLVRRLRQEGKLK